MKRRDFLKGAAALLAVGGCRCAPQGAGTVRGLRLGVQMWSVNDLWKADPAGAFRRLKALGYEGVQSFGFYAMDWKELAKMLDGEGLRIVDMPFYMKTLAGGGEAKFLDFCAQFKIDFAFEPWTQYKTAEAWRNHARELVALGARFARHGIRVGYHNHQHELKPLPDGPSPTAILCEAGLPFELDVGHVTLAGDDPVKWLRKLPGRVPSIHAKPGGGSAIGAPADTNDWRAIFDAAAASGCRWAIVECEERRNTYADVASSIAYLRSHLG